MVRIRWRYCNYILNVCSITPTLAIIEKRIAKLLQNCTIKSKRSFLWKDERFILLSFNFLFISYNFLRRLLKDVLDHWNRTDAFNSFFEKVKYCWQICVKKFLFQEKVLSELTIFENEGMLNNGNIQYKLLTISVSFYSLSLQDTMIYEMCILIGIYIIYTCWCNRKSLKSIGHILIFP